MQFLDPTLIGELSAAVLGVTQALKNRPKLRGIDGEVIAVTVGFVVGVTWFLARGDIITTATGIEWKEAFAAAINGVLGGIAASTGFNIQKFLPIPNVLPTRSEKDAVLQASAPAPTVSPDPVVDEEEEPVG